MQITALNVHTATYDEFADALEPYLTATPPMCIPSPEADDFFFRLPMYFNYVTRLWSILDHRVRDLGEKEQISKRDLAEKIMSAIKFSYECTSRRLTSRQHQMEMSGVRLGG